MEVSGSGKSPNTSLSFRYNANNEELEELYNVCEDDPPTPQCDAPITSQSENASPKRGDKTSIIDKYFKSIREKPVDKTPEKQPVEKTEDAKAAEIKPEEVKNTPPVSSSPMKEYLNRLGKRSSSEVEVKESNETWKIFHDFKFKIAQAVEDMKTRSLEETKESKEKSVPRENSTSDSEENSAMKDSDQQSVGDTDNQVSSLDSSMQNLSEVTQPLTAKAIDKEFIYPLEIKNYSDSSDDTHKNIANCDSADLSNDYGNDSNVMEVESGVEALEDTLDGFGDVTDVDTDCPKDKPHDNVPTPQPVLPTNFGLPPSKSNLNSTKPNSEKEKTYFFNFTMYFLTFIIFVNYVLFPNANAWNGFLLGIWFFCLANEVKSWMLDNYFSENEPQKSKAFLQLKRSSAMPQTYTIPFVKEHRPMKKYEGWINHYRFPDYDAYTYHINQTTTAFMKLEGCNLRISYTKTKIAKRALWDEKIENIVFYQHRLYNLTGARVILLPKGLVKRRQWSKKYPICIILNEKEKIQVLEKENVETEKKAFEATTYKKGKDTQHEVESTETNTSPEKKRKFVWRRKEKNMSHSDGETGKEGLRHRLVRKMHRDKKPDSTTACTETTEAPAEKSGTYEDIIFHDAEMDLATKSVTSTKDDEEELDDTELSKIKEFLEEAVSKNGVSKSMRAREQETGADGTVEGEWSVHVKRTTDNHSHLYLFARTGRDKHEWYRRLNIAVLEANAATPDTSAAEEKSSSDPAAENKEGIEMAVYKVTEKETVAFAKSPNKTDSISSDGVTIAGAGASQRMQSDMESYEKTFWPYLLKIIQTHDMTFKQTAEIGVMCQIEPSPHERTKSKKKRKSNTKTPSPTCQCRLLPAEVTWVNTFLARMIYDVMRDPIIIARLQNRIQRKLNTLKLPAFMSPLVVTELSLSGACPLVERVAAPAWDERGVWLDADLRYDGGAYIAILTQLNLMKLKEKNVMLEDQLLSTSENTVESEIRASTTGFSERLLRQNKPAIFDSEVEDSAESSSDDESPPVQPVDSGVNLPAAETGTTPPDAVSSRRKFIKMVDKIASNKYFQQVTDYKYVKRAMEGLSNTDIKLHLEVHGLEGRLAVNLPPPPHDRVWIGFRTNPQLVLKARPAVGARTLRFAHITNWIEQKLSKEFEKVLVMPNMEDIIVDVMTPTPVDFE